MNIDDIKEPRTKREDHQLAAAYFRYQRNPIQTLNEAYKTPSAMKVVAYNDCLEIQRELGGIEGSVVYTNCQTFTFGFIVERITEYNRERWFVYITKASIRKYLIARRYR